MVSILKTWTVMGDEFILDSRYKIVDYLGSGAYGTVCAIYDHESNETVAIKKCRKIFQSRTLAKRTLREVRLLRQFSHDNIVKLKSILMPQDINFYNDLYLIFEIMDTDLAQIIRSPQPLKEQHIQYFIYQILRGLSYLHSKHIVHRDIKPRNILINADCTLKIADFGLARVYKDQGDLESVVSITDYVTTRWYRAPEVIVGWTSYSSSIDMWAVGCIIAELINRSPLFPGENTMKQLGIIIKVLGSPIEAFILKSSKMSCRQYMFSLTNRKSLNLQHILPQASIEAIDMIKGLLSFDPSSRPSADECLSHNYITSISNALSPSGITPLEFDPQEFAFEDRKPTIEDLRFEITSEILYYSNQISAVGIESKVVIDIGSNEEEEDNTFHEVSSVDKYVNDINIISFTDCNKSISNMNYNKCESKNNDICIDIPIEELKEETSVDEYHNNYKLVNVTTTTPIDQTILLKTTSNHNMIPLSEGNKIHTGYEHHHIDERREMKPTSFPSCLSATTAAETKENDSKASRKFKYSCIIQ